MADCRDGCTTDEIFVTVVDRNGGVYSINAFGDDGITFSEDETNLTNSRDSTSVIATYGHNYVLRPATLNVKCDQNAKNLDDAWILDPRAFMCADVIIDSPCCNGQITLTNAEITSFKRTDMSTDPDASDTYVLSFKGKP